MAPASPHSRLRSDRTIQQEGAARAGSSERVLAGRNRRLRKGRAPPISAGQRAKGGSKPSGEQATSIRAALDGSVTPCFRGIHGSARRGMARRGAARRGSAWRGGTVNRPSPTRRTRRVRTSLPLPSPFGAGLFPAFVARASSRRASLLSGSFRWSGRLAAFCAETQLDPEPPRSGLAFGTLRVE